MNTTSGITELFRDVKEIETIICGDNSFNYTNKEEQKMKGIDTYFCIKNKSDISLAGTLL